MAKTKKIIAGISSTAMAFALTGCGDDSADLPPVPEDNACNDWDWESDDGVWGCSDENSPYYHHYFYAGQYYRSKNALSIDDDYFKYRLCYNWMLISLCKKISGRIPSKLGNTYISLKIKGVFPFI